MKAHILQHAEWETIGRIDEWLNKVNIEYSTTHLYKGDKLPKHKVDLLIIMGGPMGIFEDENYPWLKEEREFVKKHVNSNSLVLGICLGSQFIADSLDARVYAGKEKEIGFFDINKVNNHPITSNIPNTINVFHWHGDTFDTPKEAINLFNSELTSDQGFIYDNRVLALQFHIEVGQKEIDEFVYNGIDEIVPANYVQHKDDILNLKSDLSKSNSYLFDILDNLLDLRSTIL